LNEAHGGQVTVVSLGSEEWQEQLRRALAMGATDAVLLSDPAFANLDALGAARATAAAIKKLAPVDLVVCGRNSTDDESGAFGPSLARVLGWPQITYAGKINSVASGSITAERHLEEQVETVNAPLPAVMTMIKGVNEPRYPSLLRIRKVAKVEIPIWSAADLGLSAADLVPATRLISRVPPPARASGDIIQGATAADKVRSLVDKLLETQVI
jgi:electron transfer flavoprotein beta subunit